MKPRNPDTSKDRDTLVTWRDLGLSQGAFLPDYGLTTLASFQLITEKDFGKLRRISPAMATTVKRYLEERGRRFRLPRESFRDRAKQLYGLVHDVPSPVAAIAGGLYISPKVLNREWKLKTLKDVSRIRPETLQRRLTAYFIKTWEPNSSWFRRKYHVSPEGNVAAFVQWLKDQGVW